MLSSVVEVVAVAVVVLVVGVAVYLSICLSASLKTELFCETSSHVEVHNIKTAALFRYFLNL